MTFQTLCLLTLLLSVVGALTGHRIKGTLSVWLGMLAVIGFFVSFFLHMPLLLVGSMLSMGYFTGAMVAATRAQRP